MLESNQLFPMIHIKKGSARRGLYSMHVCMYDPHQSSFFTHMTNMQIGARKAKCATAFTGEMTRTTNVAAGICFPLPLSSSLGTPYPVRNQVHPRRTRHSLVSQSASMSALCAYTEGDFTTLAASEFCPQEVMGC